MPGQIYAVATLGGNLVVPTLSARIRALAQPEFVLRQFADARPEFGKGAGDTYLFDKVGNVATQGGTLVETNTIPETNFVTSVGTGSVYEYGNAIPFTSKLRDLTKIQVEPVTEQRLRDDQVKVLESAAGAQFVATEFVAVCSSTASVVITTNGTATATATADLTASNVRSIVDFMKKRLIPKYDARNYVCVMSVSAASGMHADSATGGWVDISKYTGEFAKNVLNGEVGTFYMTRFVEETGYLSNTIGSGSTHGQAVFIGADNVYEAVVIPEDIRLKNSVDFGRDLGMAWYALLGFQKVWNFTNDAEQHIVFVTSA